jgi:signal transduction histidine kinase
MVVLAVGLAAVGCVLALQQVQSLNQRLLIDARDRARRIAEDARVAFERQASASLHRVAEQRRRQPAAPWDRPADWPSWIDGLYEWNGRDLTELMPASQYPLGVAQLAQNRLSARAPPQTADPLTDPIEFIQGSAGTLPVVLACLTSTDSAGRPVVFAGRIHHLRLKTELVEPMLPHGSGLEIVDIQTARRQAARQLGPAMRFWAIQPSAAFLRGQQSAMLWQTLTYIGVTILALATLVAAMLFSIRVARREMTLAEMKADFVASVSHELKTPLALIRMFTETLQSGRVTSQDKQQEYCGIIMRESDRLTNLIDNILDFARIDAGRKEYNLELTNVAEVVRDTYEAYRFQLDHKQFEHRLEVEEGLPAVRADRDALSQVLLNLMSNAIKYSDEERYLSIELASDTRRDRRGVLLSVHDHGIGIAPEDRGHLFDGFFRAADGRVRRRGGTGLGLVLTKHIVEAHGGSLDVESRLVKGTTFRIFLPAAKQARPGDAAESDRDRTAAGHKTAGAADAGPDGKRTETG